MVSTHIPIRPRLGLITCLVCAWLLPWTSARAERSIHEQLAVDPKGSVEIVNVAGSVDLSGWDRAEIEVTGTVGDDVDRVDVSTSGAHSTVHVVPRVESGRHSDNAAHLTIHVPVRSAITTTLVSADLKLKNLSGDMSLQSVSGETDGEVGGNLRASAVSGDIRIKAPHANAIEAQTVSGDIRISGGREIAGGGEMEITTISGNAELDSGPLKRGRFRSVSGRLTAGLALAPDGMLEAESVSGSLRLNFAASPNAEVDVQSFSGEISSCFGPKPSESRYGPGSRLTFKNGDGKGHIHLETKSGSVRLCDST